VSSQRLERCLLSLTRAATPDATLYRYLKARNWKADASRDMLLATMKVRADYEDHGCHNPCSLVRWSATVARGVQAGRNHCRHGRFLYPDRRHGASITWSTSGNYCSFCELSTSMAMTNTDGLWSTSRWLTNQTRTPPKRSSVSSHSRLRKRPRSLLLP